MDWKVGGKGNPESEREREGNIFKVSGGTLFRSISHCNFQSLRPEEKVGSEIHFPRYHLTSNRKSNVMKRT